MYSIFVEQNNNYLALDIANIFRISRRFVLTGILIYVQNFTRFNIIKSLNLYKFDASNSVPAVNEPPHDNTNKMPCAPSDHSDQPGHPASLISLRCPHEESLGP